MAKNSLDLDEIDTHHPMSDEAFDKYFKKNPPLNTEAFANFMADLSVNDPDPNMDPENLKTVSRSEWGGVDPRRVTMTSGGPCKTVVQTYTGTPPCVEPEECRQRVKELQTEHMDQLGLPDIAWNFLIGGDGVVYEGRGFSRLPHKFPHYQNQDLETLDIAIIGRSKEEDFVTKHFASLAALSTLGVQSEYIDEDYNITSESPPPKTQVTTSTNEDQHGTMPSSLF